MEAGRCLPALGPGRWEVCGEGRGRGTPRTQARLTEAASSRRASFPGLLHQVRSDRVLGEQNGSGVCRVVEIKKFGALRSRGTRPLNFFFLKKSELYQTRVSISVLSHLKR